MEEDLKSLYEEFVRPIHEGKIIRGKIVEIGPKEVLVDIGFKSEGVIPLSEFDPFELELNKDIDVFVESVEDEKGAIVLSRDKAKKLLNWGKIEKSYQKDELIEGRISKKVKGGFIVTVFGLEGFLPTSLSTFKSIPEKEILNNSYKFKIIKLNHLRYSLILSRREAFQKEKEEVKAKIWKELELGKIVRGVVKAITDFGAFVDLGGVDGLLHITDMSWSKINHPSEVVTVGDKLEVMVLDIDRENQKISLGLKQRLLDPWADIEKKYPVGSKVKGKIRNILPYGIFVELEKGIEGLIHISEISWSKRTINPQEIFSISDTVEAKVLIIDKDSRRLSLSIKQLESNPWIEAEVKYPKGSKVTGKINRFTHYGAFLELEDNLEGMIHISDLSWTKRISPPQEVLKKGQRIEAIVLSCDPKNQRISLGLKQLLPNPWPEIAKKYPLNSVVDAEVTSLTDFGIFVRLEEDLEGLIFKDEIEKEKLEKIKSGDKIKTKVIKIDTELGKIGLSAKV